MAGAVLLGPVGLVGGFFVKGKSIDLPVGTLVYVQPESTVTISGVEVHGVDTAASVRPVEPVTTPAAPAAPAVAPKTTEATAPKAVETAKEQAAQVAPNDALIEKPVIIVKREKE